MNESILTSIKKLLGITEEYTHFDADLIIHINTVFMTLHQMGVGPTEGFKITDQSDVGVYSSVFFLLKYPSIFSFLNPPLVHVNTSPFQE